MVQLSDNVMVLNVGDPLPQLTNDAVKIYLAGTEDMNPANEHWQDKVANAMVTLSQGPGAISLFKQRNWIFFNPMSMPQLNPLPSIDNQEWVSKKNWEWSMIEQADGIFLNFLKNSVSPIPLFLFGALSTCEKMVVRCSQEYANYNIIAYTCQKNGIPLLPNSSNVKDVIWALFSTVPSLQQNQKIQLPE